MLQRALLKKTACSECCQHWFYVIKSRVGFEKRNCKSDLVQLETCDSVFLKHVQFRTFFFSHGPPNSAWICKINVGYLCLSPSVTNSVGSSVVHVILSRVLWPWLSPHDFRAAAIGSHLCCPALCSAEITSRTNGFLSPKPPEVARKAALLQEAAGVSLPQPYFDFREWHRVAVCGLPEVHPLVRSALQFLNNCNL